MQKIQMTELQRKAVESNARKIAVVAGPGSGKTRVLTERICNLIVNCNVESKNILALTFTNKAAAEMEKRTRERLNNDIKTPRISTFHKFGIDVLREFAYLSGYSNDFEIITPTEKNTILRDMLEDEGIALNEIMNISRNITYIKNGMEVDHGVTLELVDKYNNFIWKKNAFDLDDLVYKTLDLLKKNPSVREVYQNKYRYILIDEYQDINTIQKQVIDLICNEETNIFIVGDDDQCIYEWRGSTPDLLGSFIKQEDVEVIRLEENFRSDNSIVKLSDSFIAKNLNRIKKRAISRKKVEISVGKERKISFQKYSSRETEAEAICKTIEKLVKKENMQFGEFAILVRQQGQSNTIANALKENNIPFHEHTGNDERYLEIIRVLMFIENPQNDKYIVGAFNYPKRAIGNSVYKQLVESNGWGKLSLNKIFKNIYDFGEEFKNSEIFKARYELLHDLHRRKEKMKASEVLSELACHYSIEKKYGVEAELKLKTMEQIIDVAREFEKGMNEDISQCGVRSFIDYLQCTLQNEDEPEINVDSVNIMTCHKAKGLEFPAVFIPGVQVGIFPNDFFVKTSNDLEQERRLFYVSMTRAINFLFLSSNDNPFYVPVDSIIERSFIAELIENLN